MNRPRRADMLRGMIFDAGTLAADAAEFVTMDFVFPPSTRGLLPLPNVSGRSPGSRIGRLSPAFPVQSVKGSLQWLDDRMAVLGKGFPLTVAGAAAGLTQRSSHRIPLSNPSGHQRQVHYSQFACIGNRLCDIDSLTAERLLERHDGPLPATAGAKRECGADR